MDRAHRRRMAATGTRPARAALVAFIIVGAFADSACRTGLAAQAPRIPLVKGLTIVSALQFPDGDRENVVVVTEVSSAGARYNWHFEEHGASTRHGPDTGDFSRFVRAGDLASAPRLDPVFLSRGPTESPGFTAFTISRAVYQRVQRGEDVPFTVTALHGASGIAAALGQFGAMLTSRITMRGTLALASARPEPISLLLDGRRVSVPALRLTGHFHFQNERRDTDFWVAADSAHPLILKVVSGGNVLQTIRIDLPAPNTVEHELATACRAELPGIYFGYNSAALDPASARALAGVTRLLARHRDWSFVIEGHTDSIGGAASNQTLSERRAEAVRSALTTRYRVAPSRLRAVGYGATRPRESNATLEGRARNRRVELVRACAATP